MASPSPVIVQPTSASLIPVELIQVINQTYFLHLLATDPGKVIPPGKTLLSMMTHAQIGNHDDATKRRDPTAELQERVTRVVHQAFWNEALESLSSALPSIQISRLKHLYTDLLEAVSPIFPATHPIIHALSSPVPPTSSPLYSALALLKDILVGLRERCAPVRDATVDELLQTLHSPPPLSAPEARDSHGDTSTHSAASGSPPISPLARLLVDTMKSILSLADDMKSDFDAFVLGSLSETQLRGVVLQQAKLRERELVLDIWSRNTKKGKEGIRENWRTWVAAFPHPNDNSNIGDKMWILRLLLALQSDKSVTCDLPPQEQSAGTEPPTSTGKGAATRIEHSNQLPPQFFFSTPRLLYVQNYLQALVITASLRSLIRLPPSPQTMSSMNVSPGQDFMERIWTLLKAEIDTADVNGSAGETKLINLADEAIRARRLLSTSGTIEDEEETQLRSAVDRILRIRDPVFALLQGRLMSSLGKHITSDNARESSFHSESRMGTPKKLRSGRNHAEERAGKKPRLMSETIAQINPSTLTGLPTNSSAMPVIKGFEDPVLVRAVEDVYQQISASIAWVEDLWGDFI